MKVVTLSSKNQITLPVEFLAGLSLKAKARLILERAGNAILISPVKTSIVAEVAGSLTKYVHPSKLGVPFEKIMEETRRKTARKLAKEQ